MIFLSALTMLLYLVILWKALSFFFLPGTARDSDRTVAAFLSALSVMFIAARAVSFVLNPISSTASNTTVALWTAFGFTNGMFFLALIQRMTDARLGHRHRHNAMPHHGSHSS